MKVEVDGGSLYYEVIEKTPPWIEDPKTILFCHGIGTDSGVWADWLPILSNHYRIVTFDTRGFGRSLVPKRDYHWSLEALADDICSVAAAVGASRFHLIGESVGGTASLFLASRDDTPLLSLTCACTAHRGGDMELVKDFRRFITSNGVTAWSSQTMDRRFFPEALSKEKWDWYHHTQSQSDGDALIGIAELLLNTNLSAQLSRISVPTLILAPDSSPFVTLEMCCEIHSLIQHSEVAAFRRSRHGLPFSHGKQCAETVMDFMKVKKVAGRDD